LREAVSAIIVCDEDAVYKFIERERAEIGRSNGLGSSD
jgi:hypothetical protein